MIKLLDLLNEDVDTSSNTHWRDHFNAIIKCAETALSSNDPEVIASQVSAIIGHADAASNKHEATYAKAGTPTFVNSGISNSYAGDDSDINAYSGQRI